MKALFWQDRFGRRFLWGSVLFCFGIWGASNLGGALGYAAIPPFTVGLVAALSGLFWIGSERPATNPDGVVVSRYPIGHALASGALAVSGGGIVLFFVLVGGAEDLTSIRFLGAIMGLGVFALGCGATIHCATYRILLQKGEIWTSGGLKPSLRKGPYKLEDISKREGVLLTRKSPRNYQLRFTGKRSIDLSAHMTGAQAILVAAEPFYPHDCALDNCLIRTEHA
ncbi:hypothetical protein [Roseobacter sp. SK209-2-6]|uniref:hypothetical protein n=1 Tax=Roseobacter sp. SK209-2-6 TaxID=388739 RepID=UPI0005677979|nr:hypothetical protein [Roseobacter sp. SK209-2-6]